VVALEDADDREQIFEVLLRAARSRASFAALLSVHSDSLRGRRASGESGLDTSRIATLQIPRNVVPAFETAIATRAPSVGPLASGEEFITGLLELLGGRTQSALVLPVAIGARVVALIVAHRGSKPLTLADVADLFPLMTATSPALARVLAARAKAAPRPSAAYEVQVIVPDAAKRREAISRLRTDAAWEQLGDAIRDLIREGMEHGDPDEDEQLELLIELGQIEADRLGRPEQAIEAWRTAQTIDAGDARVLDALQAVFVQEGRWKDCAELLEKRIALAEEPARRISLLLELAALEHERLDDTEGAIAAYERILHWQPEHETATRELEALYSSRQQWEPLAALLLDRASRVQDVKQSVAALEAVAQMYEDKVGDLRAAFLVWLAVFRREPTSPSVLEQLARLAPGAHAWDEVLAEGTALAEELEAEHPANAAQVWALVATWTREHSASVDPTAQVAGNRTAPPLGGAAGAAQVPAGNRTAPPLGGAAGGAQVPAVEATVRALERAAALEQDPGRRSELHAALGELYATRLADPGEAIACYEQALADEPETPAVLTALHELYQQTEAWASLADILPRLIAVHDAPSERPRVLELHVEHGELLADRLGRPDDAVRAFQTALALQPGYPAAFAGLTRVYRETGQADALLETTEAELDRGGFSGDDKRYVELATQWHARGRFDRALASWQKLLARAPGNTQALRGVADALRSSEQWRALATALRELSDLVGDARERGALQLELAGVLETKLDDVDGAIVAYQAALALDPDNRAALAALAGLYDRAGQAKAAIAVLQRLLAHTTTEPTARADVFQRLGHAYISDQDLPAARSQFEQALALDLESAAAHEGIARVHLLQDELVAAGEQLVRAGELARIEADKLRCFTDAAWVFRHRLHDSERARQLLHLILDLAPDDVAAKQALADLLHDTRQWETLWPHLEQEVTRAKADANLPSGERAELYARAARCALELDKFETALDLYDHAISLDGRATLQLERAEALYRAKSLDAAAAAYQTIVLRHAQALERAQMIAVYHRLADIHTALAKLAQAQLFHQKVLELDPAHRPTLTALAELHASRARFDDAIASLRALLAVSEVAERVRLLERIGDLYRDKLKNPPRAMSTYIEALELDRGDRRVLQRLLDLQCEGGHWKAAVETIGRFLDHEADPVKRAAYHLAAAEIRRTELKDKPGALDCYDQALDELFREAPLSPATRMRGLDTFRVIDELVTADKNWKYQEQAYRRMIKRLPKNDPALLALWDALGEVYRTRLKHYQSAIEAFEIAHSLDPQKSSERASILAELYALRGPEQSSVARRAAKLVEGDPDNVDAYRALERTAIETGRIDEAWCVARALVFLRKAGVGEQALYKRYQAEETRKATGILDEDAWGYVRHLDEDRAISTIFSLVWEGPSSLRAGPAKSFELKAKERMPVEDGTRVIAKIFRHAARVLNVALPDVYIQPQRSGRLLLANCIEKGRLVPAVIVGRDLMTGYRDTEIAASVGAMLTMLRPAYRLKLTLPSVEELEAALAAAADLVGRPGLARPQLDSVKATFAAEIAKRLSRPAAENVRALVARLPDRPDLARWRAAVDMTAQRAGLLVSGELAAAARMLSTEAVIGSTRPNQRIHDLVSYSVSPPYFATRAHLGVAVA
jgi:tetratricopeptide (TPR) repeat protein